MSTGVLNLRKYFGRAWGVWVKTIEVDVSKHKREEKWAGAVSRPRGYTSLCPQGYRWLISSGRTEFESRPGHQYATYYANVVRSEETPGETAEEAPSN